MSNGGNIENSANGFDLPVMPEKPFEVDLALKAIVSYIGLNNLKDLIKCRLVNKQWNSIALSELKANDFTVKLNCSNIREYKAVAKTVFDLYGQNPGLGLTIDIIDNHQLDESHTRLNNMIKEIMNQTTLDGLLQTSIKTINYIGSQAYVTEEEVWKLISAASPSLKYLNFNGHFLQEDPFGLGGLDNPSRQVCIPSVSKNKEQVEIANASFLHLQRIYYSITAPSQDNSFERFINLLSSTPTLQSLSLISNPVEQHYHGTPEQVSGIPAQVRDKMLRFFCGLSFTAIPSWLTELEIPLIDDEFSRDFLFQLEFMSLEKLKLHQKTVSYNLQASFCDFLIRKCPSLTSLEIYYLLFRKPNDDDDIPVLPIKPTPWVFPKVTHFGLFDMICSSNGPSLSGVVRVIDNLIFAMESFPNLTSISLSAVVLPALCISLVTDDFCEMIHAIIFPRVVTMKIEADVCISFRPEPTLLLIKQRQMFPNLDKISFRKIRPLHLFRIKPDNLVPTYFAARCLEFKHYDVDWLNLLFELGENETPEMQIPKKQLDELRNGLQVLTVRLLKKYDKWGHPVANDSKPVFQVWIRNILKTFPNIRQLEVEDKVFQRVGELELFRPTLYKELELLKVEYPLTKITLL